MPCTEFPPGTKKAARIAPRGGDTHYGFLFLVFALRAVAMAPAFVRAHLRVHRLHARLHLRVACFAVAMFPTHGAAFRRGGLGRLLLRFGLLREQRGCADSGGGQGCGNQQLTD